MILEELVQACDWNLVHREEYKDRIYGFMVSRDIMLKILSEPNLPGPIKIHGRNVFCFGYPLGINNQMQKRSAVLVEKNLEIRSLF
jgi:hypothetical protein